MKARKRHLATNAALFVIILLPVIASGCNRVAGGQPSTLGDFERATSGMTRTETAKYVYSTYGCNGCHTINSEGNTGLTPVGEVAAQGFTGCVRLLTAVSASVAIPAAERTDDQRRIHQKFGDYGCTFCHKVEPGKMSFTEIGSKLAYMHLGCVEVREELQKRPGD